MKLRWLALALLAGLAVPFIVPALAADQTVTVSNNSFSPRNVGVMPGDTVTWQKSGTGTQHNIVWEDGAPTQPATGLEAASWTVSRKFDNAGEYEYYCEFHGTASGAGMVGKVYVNADGTVPATTPTNTSPTNTTPTNTTGTNTTGTNTTGTNTPADTTSPSISSLQGSSRFCRRRSRTCRRPGLRFRLELSEAATIEGLVTRTGKARRTARRRSFTRTGRQGANRIKVSARGLAKGRYRLRLRARDAAGNVSRAGVKRFTLR